MHTYIKTLVMALVAAVAPAAPAAGAGQPVWPATLHDFGAFDEDRGPVTARFYCINRSDAPLVIVSARATCGCTTPQYTPGAVAPGDTATVTVTYDPSARPGQFTKKVYVTTACGENREKTTLIVRGVVVGNAQTVARTFPVDAGPLRLARPALLMGDIIKGHVKSVFLNACSACADTTHISVTGVPRWLEAKPMPADVPPGTQATISFFVKSDFAPALGLLTDTVTVNTACGGQRGAYRLPVILTVNQDFSAMTAKDWQKAPAATIENPAVALGDVAPGTPVTAVFTIKNTGKGTLTVHRAYSTQPGVTATVDRTRLKPGKTALVTVTYDGPDTVVSAGATVITDDPASPVQTVRLTAQRAADSAAD